VERAQLTGPAGVSGTAGLSTGLITISGYVDTVGFLALAGLFTAHVTGNFVLIGAALVSDAADAGLKLLVFPAFVIGVAASRLLALAQDRRSRSSLALLLMLELLLLAGFVVCEWMGQTGAGPRRLMAIGAGASGAAAMGVQNGLSRSALPGFAQSTAMTGHVTLLVMDVVDLLRGAGDAVTRNRGAALALSIAGFAGGAVLGAFAYVQCGFAAMLLPVVAVGVLAWVARGAAPKVPGHISRARV
jgi:uncharacterized membrane protein YoaK (UPF0700 family)